MQRRFGEVIIECCEGDITRQSDMEAIVNAANAQLMPGGGVAGAIHRAAGPGLAEECAPLAPIKPGEAVLTSGHDLPNRYVIHCLGPVYGRDVPADILLGDCYLNALRRAEEHGIASIAFPAISTGIFGYPLAEAAPLALAVARDAVPKLQSVRHLRFVLRGSDALRAHTEALAGLAPLP